MFKKAALKMSKLRTCFFTSLLLTVKLEKEAGNHFFFYICTGDAASSARV